MSNRIDATLQFSYQGQTYSPSATIDLDAMMESRSQLPDLHQYLAQQNQIDTYSYMYEVMESHEIVFSNASGLAQQCLKDGHFDLANFETLWLNCRESFALADIAQQYLDVSDLEQHEQLKQALLAAYQLGKSADRQFD